jgi:hypothetical protein
MKAMFNPDATYSVDGQMLNTLLMWQERACLYDTLATAAMVATGETNYEGQKANEARNQVNVMVAEIRKNGVIENG